MALSTWWNRDALLLKVVSGITKQDMLVLWQVSTGSLIVTMLSY
jgi:hypothetical protein